MVQLGLFGKHPERGDFLTVGPSARTAQMLGDWLAPTLHGLATQMGARWPTFWSNAPAIRFWIGRDIVGTTLAGVLVPSHDKVGRRYPLMLMVEGARVPPPVSDTDQELYHRMTRLLEDLRRESPDAAKDLIAGLDLGLGKPEVPDSGTLVWAEHPSGDLSALLTAAGPVDAVRAQASRSYWWRPGLANGSAAWLGAPGLPGADALGWVMSGTGDRSAMEEDDV